MPARPQPVFVEESLSAADLDDLEEEVADVRCLEEAAALAAELERLVSALVDPALRARARRSLRRLEAEAPKLRPRQELLEGAGGAASLERGDRPGPLWWRGRPASGKGAGREGGHGPRKSCPQIGFYCQDLQRQAGKRARGAPPRTPTRLRPRERAR